MVTQMISSLITDYYYAMRRRTDRAAFVERMCVFVHRKFNVY